MLCGLGEEECTKFRKQKLEKEKKLNAAKSVRRDDKVSYDIYHNHVKYFLPYLNRFWIRPLFTPNF